MILTSVLYGLAFAIGIGVADVVSAGLTRSLGVLRTVFLLQLTGVVALTALGLSTGQLGGLEPRYWLIMAGMTLLVAGFYLGFFKALQVGPIALVGPIVAAHSVVVALMAVVFLGESVSQWQVGAMALTVVGVAIASVDVRALRSGRTIIGLGVVLAIVVCVAAGFWQFALAALSREIGWFAPVYLTRLMMVSILPPILLIRRELPWRGTEPAARARRGIRRRGRDRRPSRVHARLGSRNRRHRSRRVHRLPRRAYHRRHRLVRRAAVRHPIRRPRAGHIRAVRTNPVAIGGSF